MPHAKNSNATNTNDYEKPPAIVKFFIAFIVLCGCSDVETKNPKTGDKSNKNDETKFFENEHGNKRESKMTKSHEKKNYHFYQLATNVSFQFFSFARIFQTNFSQ